MSAHKQKDAVVAQSGVVVSKDGLHSGVRALVGRWWKLILAVLSVVVVIVVVVLLYHKHTTEGAAACSQSILVSASGALDPTETATLEPIVSTIRKQDGYTKDVNCLYVVTIYNINMSDYQSARTSLTQLEKVYKSSVGYSAYLGKLTLKPSQLENSVKFLHNQDKAILSNGFGGVTHTDTASQGDGK